MYLNETGGSNVAVGSSALYLNASGEGNTAVGALAMVNNGGNYNTAVGWDALAYKRHGFRQRGHRHGRRWVAAGRIEQCVRGGVG